MTIGEVLSITVDELRSVHLPAELSESIGVPICHAIRNMKECIAALENARAEAEAKAANAKETNEEVQEDNQEDCPENNDE